jgi:hypothetical protein
VLQINVGDIGARIARALSIKGRIPVALDETAVPVAQLFDFTDSLFSQNPATFIANLPIVGGTPNFGAVQYWVPPTINVVAKIDAVILSDVSTTVPVNPLLLYLTRNTSQIAGSSAAQDTAILNQDVGSTQTLPLRTQGKVETANPAANPFAAAGVQLWQWQAPQGGIVQIPLGVVLFPGDSFGVSNGPEAASVTRFVTIYGREYAGV